MVDAAFKPESCRRPTGCCRPPARHRPGPISRRAKCGIDTGFYRVPAFVPAIRKKQGLSGRIHDNERDGRQRLQETRHTASIVHGQEAELRVPMRLASSSPWRRRMGRSSKDTWSAGRIPRTAAFAKARGLKRETGAGAANVEAWWFRYHRAAKARVRKQGRAGGLSLLPRGPVERGMPHRFPPLTASWRALATRKRNLKGPLKHNPGLASYKISLRDGGLTSSHPKDAFFRQRAGPVPCLARVAFRSDPRRSHRPVR